MPDPLRQTVSASQIAALYGRSPYQTEWMLYQDFTGQAELFDHDNERMLLGRLLERPILELTSRRLRLNVLHNDMETFERQGSLGCTVDGMTLCPSRGLGAVQAKNVDRLQWLSGWTDTAAPPYIELQLQCEMAVRRADWGVIAALVGGNDLLIYERRPDESLIADMMKRARAFLDRVEARDEPPMEGRAIELPQLDQLYADPPELIRREAMDDQEASEAVRLYDYWRAAELFAKKSKDEARTKLLCLAGGAQQLRTHGALTTITRNAQPATGPELPWNIQDQIIKYLARPDRDAAAVPALQAALLSGAAQLDEPPKVRTSIKVEKIAEDGSPPWESWVPDKPEFL